MGWCQLPSSLLEILRFFEQYPGDIVYYLVIIALAQVSLFFAFGQRRRFPDALTTQRYFLAATTLLGLWIIILAAAIVALLTPNEPGSLLPPLERLAQTLSVSLLAWALLAADENTLRRPGNLSALGLVLIVLFFFAYTAYQWYTTYETGGEFNASVFAPVWSAIALAIAVAALLLTLLYAASLEDAPLKSLFFILLALGNGWDLYQFTDGVSAGNYLGGARLAYMGSLSIVPLLLYRQAISLLTRTQIDGASAHAPQPMASPERDRPSDDDAAATQQAQDAARETPSTPSHEDNTAALLASIGAVLSDDEVSTIPQRVVKAATSALGVELCLFLRSLDSNYAELTAGYDADAQRSFAGPSINLDALPALRKAFASGQPIELGMETYGAEVAALFRQLDIEAPSAIYLQPVTHGADILALLAVASPARTRVLTSSETESLQALASLAGHVLHWQQQAATSLAFDETDETATSGMEASDHRIDPSQITEARNTLESSLQQTLQDIANLRASNAELRSQLHEEQVAVLNELGDDAEAISVAQQISNVFDELSKLREANEIAAADLLERETALRIQEAESVDQLRQVILDYARKSHASHVDNRARLQGQLDATRANVGSISSDEPNALVEALSDQSLRLEREREALAARQAELLSEFESIGINAELSGFAQVLIQHYSERSTLQDAVTAIAHQRDNLRKERNRIGAARAEEMESLREQLDRMSADHETLLDQRENMRRAHEVLQRDLETRALEVANLANEGNDLRQELSASASQHEHLKDFIVDLTEERDNLLRIRDQLTNRLTAALEGDDRPAESTLRKEATQLRALVNDLTGQRERLEAELRNLQQGNIAVVPVRHDQEAALPDAQSVADDDTMRTDIVKLVEDLRTPVTAIMDGADLLLAERIGILGAAQLQVLQHISVHISRFAEIVDDLRNAAKISSDKLELNYGEADLVALLDTALGKHSDQLRRKELAIDLSLGDALPKVPMDTLCIGRILDQLLANACEVSPKGSQIQLALEVSRQTMPETNVTPEFLHLQVKDSGGGIEPDDIERLFARKYKTENPRIKGYSDIGVGLTVSRAHARAHGGDVWITSESGDGSTIHLALPISPSSAAEA